MFLKRKIPASSIAEVVVALAVIAICFGIASLVFVRSAKTTSKFMDVKKQTEIQSEIMEKMLLDDLPEIEKTSSELELDFQPSETSDSLTVIHFLSDDERIVWTQELMK